jgi:F0F1-type ATP synthase alpha subunit
LAFFYEESSNPSYSENSEVNGDEYDELHPRYWTNHGYVYSLGDGIIVVYGLYNVTAGEMVLFSRSNIIGMALNLTSDYVGVLPFDDEQYITEGDVVNRLNK